MFRAQEIRVLNIATNVSLMADSNYHGRTHWERVAKTSIMLCEMESTTSRMPVYFAFLHDCMRLDEHLDIEHGPRAAKLAVALRPVIEMDDTEYELMIHAIREHTDGQTSSHPLVGICWDADRIDLPRVNIMPHPKYMSTRSGKIIAHSMQQQSASG